MAILSEDDNEYEVRIMRSRDGTYFDEYVKVGDREKLNAVKVDRYIVAEPGTVYSIEITLKEGFNFDSYSHVRVKLYLPGAKTLLSSVTIHNPSPYSKCTKRDVHKYLETVNNQVDYSNLFGCRFSFRGLALDEQLVNETNVMGVNPRDLGSFSVCVARRSVENRGRLIKTQPTINGGEELKRIRTVDAKNYKKHGITCALGFDETVVPTTETRFREGEAWYSETLEFRFHCRTKEFLEQLNIVQFPPPLFCYSWDNLKDAERRLAFKELQELNKIEVRSQNPGASVENQQQRKEWRAWNTLDPHERKHIFQKLQKEHREFERGEVLNQVTDVPAHKIIVLYDDEHPRVGAAASRTLGPNASFLRSGPPLGKNVRATKEEPIDIEGQATNRVSLKRRRPNSPATPIIKHKIIDLEDPGAIHGTMAPANTIKYDLTELDSPFAKKIKVEKDDGASAAPIRVERVEEIATESRVYVKIEEDMEMDGNDLVGGGTAALSLEMTMTEEEQLWLEEEMRLEQETRKQLAAIMRGVD